MYCNPNCNHNLLCNIPKDPDTLSYSQCCWPFMIFLWCVHLCWLLFAFHYLFSQFSVLNCYQYMNILLSVRTVNAKNYSTGVNYATWIGITLIIWLVCQKKCVFKCDRNINVTYSTYFFAYWCWSTFPRTEECIHTRQLMISLRL